MAKRKNVLTTGDVAKVCNVALRTAQKWFDTGMLKGYRLPFSTDRRVRVEDLAKFMAEHGIPGQDWLKEWQQNGEEDNGIEK
jgi:hypothetical protein